MLQGQVSKSSTKDEDLSLMVRAKAKDTVSSRTSANSMFNHLLDCSL